jgi:hypothetical protein
MAKDYPNRSDLRNPMQQAKFTGQTYGQATQQTQSQQAVPAGPSPTSSVAPTQPVNRLLLKNLKLYIACIQMMTLKVFCLQSNTMVCNAAC